MEDYPREHVIHNHVSNVKDTSSVTNNIVITARVAYVISITHCNWELIEAAAVHGHSVDKAHHQHSNHTVNINASTSVTITATHSRHAIVHPDAKLCLPILQEVLQYQTQLQDVPLALDTIQSPVLRRLIDADNSGCCGAKELLKLYAFTLTEQDVAIHLDTDVLVFRPPWDVIADMLLDKTDDNRTLWSQAEPLPTQAVRSSRKSNRPNFFFTRDYLQSSYHNVPEKFAVQGGMFILRPSVSAFKDLITTIQRSRYAARSGWGEANFGGFWGAPQVQGLLSYYYHRRQQHGSAIELNRCYYNNMGAEPPRWYNVSRKAKYQGQCTTTRPTCQDCRMVKPSEIIFAHYTMCGKPWKCSRHVTPDPTNLCFVLHQAWFAVRESLEQQEPYAGTRIRWPTVPQGRREDRPFWSRATLSYCTNPNTLTEYKPKRGTYHPLIFINISSLVAVDLIEPLTPTKPRKRNTVPKNSKTNDSGAPHNINV